MGDAQFDGNQWIDLTPAATDSCGKAFWPQPIFPPEVHPNEHGFTAYFEILISQHSSLGPADGLGLTVTLFIVIKLTEQ